MFNTNRFYILLDHSLSNPLLQTYQNIDLRRVVFSCVGDDIAKAKGLPDTKLYGGYSQKITVDENYVMRIPDPIDLSTAAPLLCAGITMFSPLNFYGAKAGGKQFVTAIAGLGGLGAAGAGLPPAAVFLILGQCWLHVGVLGMPQT